MKERPILFSGEMVRAILDGRKTQTRRIVKPALVVLEREFLEGFYWDWKFESVTFDTKEELLNSFTKYCPYGKKKDRLWVRETWRQPEDHEDYERGDILYAASERDASSKWKPSIHMPRWASRIFLEIVSVRVERLQDITETDAISEGCANAYHPDFHTGQFRELWESINGPGSWEKNPWVWVINFRRLK